MVLFFNFIFLVICLYFTKGSVCDGVGVWRMRSLPQMAWEASSTPGIRIILLHHQDHTWWETPPVPATLPRLPLDPL